MRTPSRDLLAPHELAGPAVRIAADVAGRRISAREVVDLHLQRIEVANPHLNAVVTVRADEARDEANALDAHLDRLPPGQRTAALPLAGVPFTVKDIIAVTGVRSTGGVFPLSNYIPKRGSPAVERLLDAGAILLGKSNCPDLALDIHTANPLFGDTRNPWDVARTPGGSSGGDAAAVASGMVAFGIGTDYGGSIRWPAHCCGLASIRPTGGLIPGTGQLPCSAPAALADFARADWLVPPNSMSFQGQVQRIAPMARHVRDLWTLLTVMAGPDGRDGSCAAQDLGKPNDVELAKLSCAWFTSEGTFPVRDDIAESVRKAAQVFRQHGLRTANIRPPGLEMVEPVFSKLRVADGLDDHRRVMGDRLGSLSPVLAALFDAERPASVAEYRQLAAERDSLRALVLEFMEMWNLLLLPIAGLPAFEISQAQFVVGGIEVPRFGLLGCCRAISLLNLPAACVPFGRSIEGLPIGIQIVGRPFREREVLAAASLIEDAAPIWAIRHPS